MCGHFTVVSDNLKAKKANDKIKEWREDRDKDKDGEKSWNLAWVWLFELWEYSLELGHIIKGQEGWG